MPKGYSVNPHKDRRGLTPQQAKFVDAAPKIGPDEAAKIAYPDALPESQRVIAHQNMANPSISSNISKISDSLGLTKEACVTTIKDKLKDRNGHVALDAAKTGLKLHGELRESNQSTPGVSMSKEAFVEMCKAFWIEKPD